MPLHLLRAPAPSAPSRLSPSDLELVSLADVLPSVLIDCPFTRTDNPFQHRFFKENVIYLRRGTAKKLAAVEKDLLGQGLRLKIWCGYRPLIVQEKMYELAGRNGNWVSDPYRNASKMPHVRAVAVDCTLADMSGQDLAMPTPYLDFARGARKMKLDCMDLPPNVLANRAMLQQAMVRRQMRPYRGEWWHFEDQDINDYPVITSADFPAIDRRLLIETLLAGK